VGEVHKKNYTVVGAQAFGPIHRARLDPDDGGLAVKSTPFGFRLVQGQVSRIVRPLRIESPSFWVKAPHEVQAMLLAGVD